MKYIFLGKKRLGTYPAGALIYYIFFFLIQYLSRDIQFSRASLNGALTCLFVPREVKKILRGFPYSFWRRLIRESWVT